MVASVALYIHVPWCIKKCPYCDFNSHAKSDVLPEAAYLAALLRDFDAELDWYGQRPVLASIFIGGGTPSLLSAGFYRQLLGAIGARVSLASALEITLEANPGTVDSANFEGFRQAGIDRLSIGVQSFNHESLQALGRVHGPDEARRAFARARAAGFDNINIDLMHGLPGQEAVLALADLQQAIDLDPEHLSWYQLTIEPNTAFYSSPPRLPAEQTLHDIQDRGNELLAAAGFAQYEVSAYARNEKYALHNLNYWHFGDYMGIGAGAHGKLLRGGEMYRRWKTRMPESYMQATDTQQLAGQKRISAEEMPVEFMMNALRLKHGFRAAEYAERTGQPPESIAATVESLCARALLEKCGDRITTTATGWRFLNDVVAAFLPD
ncbi:MAG: radical SAM family heme chaperone HemW [Pseudomonadales bacterium]